MPTRVIIPPEPLITPASVPGDHAADDAAVAAMIAAATRVIDGPNGWVGRCFGPQTLEFSSSCWTDIEFLPYGPVIDIVSVSYIDADGTSQTVSSDYWSQDGDNIYFGSSWTGPTTATRSYPIRIRYEAGYDGVAVEDGGTGDVPPEVAAALIEAVQQLILARSDSLGVRSFTVEDIESVTYLDADKVSAIIRTASAGLLGGLKVMYV